jgi:hypothetical protein
MQSLAFMHINLRSMPLCEIPNVRSGPRDAADEVRRIAANVQFIFNLKNVYQHT